MSRFNKPGVRSAPRSAIVADKQKGTTKEGGKGYKRDAQGELFTLAVSHFGEDKFYEPGADGSERLVKLVRKVASESPEWLPGFTGWLRSEAYMRKAPVMIAAEAVHAMSELGQPGGRSIVRSALARSDEPGELAAYWTEAHGTKAGRWPWALKRGLADAAANLYSEFTTLKYDTDSHAFRFGDIIELSHATAKDNPQNALFRYAIDRRHGRDKDAEYELAPELGMVAASLALRKAAAADPAVLLDTNGLRQAGFTWEDALSLAGNRIDKAKLWEAMIPLMGYGALLKNLRNFDQAGVSAEAKEAVARRLADPDAVLRSKQFPMRFLTAYRNAPSVQWSWPLEQAMGYSVGNVPRLDGDTLILVDTSRSMNDAFSKDGTVRRWDAAAQFALAMARSCAHADVVSFSGRGWYHEARTAVTKVFPQLQAESLVKALDRWKEGGYFLDAGTDTALALRKHYQGHKRVVIFTDEQTGEDPVEVSESIPAKVPMYTWNLAGYKKGHAPSGSNYRHAFAGLTDSAFKMIPLLERGSDAPWPWEIQAAQ